MTDAPSIGIGGRPSSSLHYLGRGLEGDQELDRDNESLRQAVERRVPIRVFEQLGKNKYLDHVLDKVPKRLWPDIRHRLREVWSSESRAECELRRDALKRWLEAHGQASAAETVLRDWDDFVTFYDFPAEHWIHLRTSNPIESLFAGVRLRTNVAKRMRRRENALYLVFKIAQRLEHSWRPLERRADAHDPAARWRPLRRRGVRAGAGVGGLRVGPLSSLAARRPYCLAWKYRPAGAP